MEFLFLLALPFLAFAFGGGGGDSHEGEDLTGTDADEIINGGSRGDHIDAAGGDDFVYGLGGNDTIDSGTGNDFASGGLGNDVVSLSDGDDTTGDHYVDENDDVQYFPDFSAGNDVIYGGAGADILVDTNGTDTIFGGTGADMISTIDHFGNRDAPDQSTGGWGADTMLGDDGDTMTGNQGDDYFVVWTDQAADKPAIITDFDGRHDILDLAFDSDHITGVDNADLTGSVDPVSGDITLSVAGRAVAVLTAPANFDIAQVLVGMHRSNELI